MADDETPADNNVMDFQKKKLETPRSGGDGRGRNTRNATDDNGRGPFRAGQEVICQIVQAQPGGYVVMIQIFNLPGFLPTDQQFSSGDRVSALYVCMHNGRMLLSSRLTSLIGDE